MMEQSPVSLLLGWLKKPEPELELAPLERSTVPDAPMSLFMRIQTVDGPRTVVASGVTVAAASLISEALAQAGHYAEFVDQCATKDTVPERVRRNRLENLPKVHMLDRTARRAG
ncbi:MAG TPA: hypothetical protein VMU31_02905 [Rhizomicrobium sp.]|nr:hypothetical protein [Rhizomicrobium sp.]